MQKNHLKSNFLRKWTEFKKASMLQSRRDYAESIDVIKDRREKILKSNFRKWQIDVLKEFNTQYEDLSPVITLSHELKDDLAVLLLDHYWRTSESLIHGIDFGEVKQVVEIPFDGSNEDNDYIDFLIPQILRDIENSINDHISVQSPIHYESIVETTEKMGNEAKSIANKSLEAVFSVVLGRKLAGRETTVSVTETNWIAESSQAIALEVTTPVIGIADKEQLKELQKISPNTTLKNTDIDELFFSESSLGISKFKDEISHPMKEWLTMGDKRVRETHKVMDAVQIKAELPFKLKGGLMMFPSDASLGVSFLEIIGCRCMAVYY
jgi:hypothetical protein